MRLGFGLGLGFNNSGGGGGGPAPTPVPATPTIADSVTFEGVEWRAWDAESDGNAKEIAWYLDADGWPCIVADADTWFDTDLPSSDGASGMEKDPWFPDGQGLDALWAEAGSGMSSAVFAYTPSLNIDPGKTGVRVRADEVGSYVKAKRWDGLTTPSQWSIFDRLSVLTVLAEAPNEGFFAPAVTATDKTPPLYSSEINWAALGSAFDLAAGMPSLESCESSDYLKSSVQPYWGPVPSEARRRAMIVNTSLVGGGYSGGAGGFGIYWSEWFHAMRAQGSTALRASPAPLYKALRIGLELAANAARGFDNNGGAGQAVGRKQFVQLLGHIKHGFMTDALATRGGTTHQPYWEFAENVGTPRGGWDGVPSNHNIYRGTATETDVGRPAWNQEPVSGVYPPSTATTMDRHIAADYNAVAGTVSMLEMLNIMLLKAGPSGWDGSQVVAQSASDFSSANPYAACIAYWDFYRTLPSSQNSGTRPYDLSPYKAAHALAYDQRRDDVVAPRWQGVPYAFAAHVNVDEFLYPLDGGFGWETAEPLNLVWPTLDVTQIDLQYSLDGRQYVEETDVGRAGTKTSDVPVGVPILARLIAHNALGKGLTPVNYPREIGDPNRMEVTAAGTPSGAPVNSVAPLVMLLRYSTVGEELFDAAATDGAQDVTYYASKGWWPSGDLTGGFGFQWLRDGEAISGATSDSYTTTSSDAGAEITCEVSVGGVEVVTSNSVVLPGASYPAFGLTAFDGVNDYLMRTTAFSGGMSDGKRITFAMRLALTGGDGVTKVLARLYDAAGTSSADIIFGVDRLSSNAIQVTARAAGTTVFSRTSNSPSTLTTANGEVTLMVSLDLDAGTYHFYLDNTAMTMGAVSGTLANINLAGIVRAALLGTITGTAALPANFRYAFFHPDYIDLSVSDNRDKFLTANIGDQGEGLFGTPALVMIYGDAASLNAGSNYGTGGNFTMSGSVTDV